MYAHDKYWEVRASLKTGKLYKKQTQKLKNLQSLKYWWEGVGVKLLPPQQTLWT